MKPLLTLCVLLSATAPCLADCYDNAITQTELNRCAGSQANDAQQQLHQMLASLHRLYADDEAFLQALTQAQSQWAASLEADLALKYPLAEKQAAYGSAYPLCLNSYRTGLIEARIAFLQQWLEGVEEGDVCSGSLMPAPAD